LAAVVVADKMIGYKGRVSVHRLLKVGDPGGVKQFVSRDLAPIRRIDFVALSQTLRLDECFVSSALKIFPTELF